MLKGSWGRARRKRSNRLGCRPGRGASVGMRSRSPPLGVRLGTIEETLRAVDQGFESTERHSFATSRPMFTFLRSGSRLTWSSVDARRAWGHGFSFLGLGWRGMEYRMHFGQSIIGRNVLLVYHLHLTGRTPGSRGEP